MNPALMGSILELAAFLALNDDDVVDRDSASKQLEYLAVNLADLSREEREAFVRYLEERAALEQETRGPKVFVEFLLSFADDFGLND